MQMELSTPGATPKGAAASSPEAPLEQAFREAEENLAASARAAAALVKATKSATEAAKVGNVRALSRAVQNAQAALRETQPGLDAANKTLQIDFGMTLRTGQFAEEVIRVAELAGLRGVRHIHGAVLSFPVALFPNAETLSVRYGKKGSSSLRPSAVVAQLQELRKHQKAARAMQKLVDALERVYLLRTQDKLAVPIPIQAVYELVTPLPGQRDEYTDIDFVADLYALERAGALKSSAGHRLSFPASTSTKFKKSIRIATEDGEERLYSSIRFDK